MSERRKETIRIDDRLESYRSFFDHEWARRIIQLANDTVLDEPVFALSATWKSIANTHLMPWLLTNCLASQLQSILGSKEPMAETAIRLIHDQLLLSVGDSIPAHARERLSARIDNLSAGAAAARDESNRVLEQEYGPIAFWGELLQANEFRLSIWGSQRVCYGALYHAFENFARQCVAIASGESSDWRPSRDIKDAACQLYGAQFANACLADDAITSARLVRNALAHNGGKLTKELRGINHGLMVENDKLQIMACDTAMLYHMLKPRAYDLAEKTLSLVE